LIWAALFAAAIAGAAALAVSFAESAVRVRPARRTPSTDPEGSEPVTLTTSDRVLLRGSLALPREWNGEAAIVLHGFTDTRAGVAAHAGMLLQAGYAVLSYDSRGHGESGGEIVGFGAFEAADLGEWAEWLCRRLNVDSCIGLGVSMGAAVLLNALGCRHGERIRLCIAESPYARFEEVAAIRVADRARLPLRLARIVLALPVAIAYAYVRLRYGFDIRRHAPIEALGRTRTPVLFIHGDADRTIPASHSRRMNAAHPDRTKLVLIPGARHAEPIEVAGETYREHVLAWLAPSRQGAGLQKL